MNVLPPERRVKYAACINEVRGVNIPEMTIRLPASDLTLSSVL